jgi:hypothetical protein
VFKIEVVPRRFTVDSELVNGGSQWFEVVHSCSKCVQSRGGFVEVHGGFAVVRGGFGRVHSGCAVFKVFTVVRS